VVNKRSMAVSPDSAAARPRCESSGVYFFFRRKSLRRITHRRSNQLRQRTAHKHLLCARIASDAAFQSGADLADQLEILVAPGDFRLSAPRQLHKGKWMTDSASVNPRPHSAYDRAEGRTSGNDRPGPQTVRAEPDFCTIGCRIILKNRDTAYPERRVFRLALFKQVSESGRGPAKLVAASA